MRVAKPVPSEIPAFASRDEEAKFWDTHSLADLQDALEPIEIEVEQPLGHILSVRLESAAFRRLTAIAQQRGVGFIALAEAWLLDALERAEAGERAAERRPPTT